MHHSSDAVAIQAPCSLCIVSAMLSTAIFTLAYRSATQIERTEAVVISASTAAISTMAAAFIYLVGGTGVAEWAPELDDMDLPKCARTRPVSAG